MADQGIGVALAHDSGFYTSVITSLNWSGIERAEIDTTHFGTTGAKTNEPAELYDPGSIDIEGFAAPGTTPAIIAGDAAETATVTWTDAGAATWAASGWMQSFSLDASEGEERVKFNATIRLSGVITITP